jgi:predicted glycoside hydrolase/deacetylase ChbG (UPF0249 family)
MSASSAVELRRIWLCADDYGISPGVNSAIRDLVVRGHLNATSAMLPAPSCNRSEARALNMLNATAPRVSIGLHVTLTAPFRPLSKDFAPLHDGAFLTLGQTLRHALLRRFRPAALSAEIEAQLRAFIEMFGRAPDFVDGHQHVQLFPQIRDAVLRAMSAIAPKAWARQCGRSLPARQRLTDRKGLLLDLLSRGFRRRAQRLGVRTNPGFAGTYDYNAQADFAVLFPRFLECLPDGGVVMCHPGFVDAELQRLDPLTHLREREYAFLAQASFPDLLAAHGAALAAGR